MYIVDSFAREPNFEYFNIQNIRPGIEGKQLGSFSHFQFCSSNLWGMSNAIKERLNKRETPTSTPFCQPFFQMDISYGTWKKKAFRFTGLCSLQKWLSDRGPCCSHESLNTLAQCSPPPAKKQIYNLGMANTYHMQQKLHFEESNYNILDIFGKHSVQSASKYLWFWSSYLHCNRRLALHLNLLQLAGTFKSMDSLSSKYLKSRHWLAWVQSWYMENSATTSKTLNLLSLQ